MITHEVEFERAEELLQGLYPNGRLGGLTIDGLPPASVGARVDLVVHIRTPARRHFCVRTRLSWARRKGARGLKECFGLDFLEEDASARERLVSFALGKGSVETVRYEQRRRLELPVVLTYDGIQRHEQLADLSIGGAFVRSQAPLPRGCEVELSMRPPRALTRLNLPARVVWLRRTGDAAGMGLEFAFETPKQAERLQKLLARLVPPATQPDAPRR
ncbi:MAG: PilZ domain-containing protein [Myxococcaceae bacterium]